MNEPTDTGGLRPGDPGYAAWYASTHRILCAHANDGLAMHWLKPGERCPLTPARAAEPEADREAVPLESDGLRQAAAYLDQAEAGREAGQ
jgi:hypothetical protein